MATQAAYGAFAEAFNDPGSIDRKKTGQQLADVYARRWAYYKNLSAAVYSRAYIDRCKAEGRLLYGYTRLLFNPVPTVCAFYEDHLLPSVAEEVKDEDGKVLAHLATPLAEGASLELRLAVAQVDQWSNWLSEGIRFVRFGAVTGSVGAEVWEVRDSERVSHRILWPSLVDYVRQDEAGNVKEYALEYKVQDPATKETYQFRKEVDGNEFRFYRAGRLFDPPERKGDTARTSQGVYTNEYGFAPMVWAKHTDNGSERGDPAVWNEEKIDEVNSLASHGADHGHKSIEAGKVIATDGDILPVTGASGASRRGESGGVHPYDTRTDWLLLKTMKDASVHDLGSSFDLSKLDPQIDRLLKSFDKDYPELQAQEIIQNKSQLSGAALERLLAPSQKKLDRAFAVYGHQIVKLKQMSVAIAGWRANGGGWTKRDAQRAVFKDFGLDSYGKGELNFGLRRPLLVQSTPMEEEELKAKKAERAKSLDGVVDDLEKLKIAGYSEGEAQAIIDRRGDVKPPPAGEQ